MDSASKWSAAARVAAALVVFFAAAGSGDTQCSPVPTECAGEDCSCSRLPRGIAITEIMAEDWGTCPEWFEILNASAHDVEISGWALEDPVTGQVAVVDDGGISLAAGATAILGPTVRESAHCGYFPDGSYGQSGFSLGLYAGGIVLRDAQGRVQDALSWDRTWGFRVGQSREVIDPALDNSRRGNWALSWTELGLPGGSFHSYGTPHWVPPAAADAPPCDDGNACTEDYCDSQAGCVHVLSDATCDDDDNCWVDGRCEYSLGGARCVGRQARSCDDADPCTADGCDPLLPGGCRHWTFEVCSGEVSCEPGLDGACPTSPRPCFTYVCSQAGRCELEATTATCDDRDACTVDDRCTDGVCRGSAPEQYLTCTDPRPQPLSWEGICVPDLDGIAYVFWLWNEAGSDLQPVFDEEICLTLSSPCGDVRWWAGLEACVIVVR